MKRWRTLPAALVDVLAVFLLHQGLFITSALVAIAILPPYAGSAYSTWHTSAPPIIDASWRWDAQWYASIVIDGYRPSTGYQNLAFFPLYPTLIRLVTYLVGEASFPWVGALLSRLAFLAALAYLYRVVLLDSDRATAARTILYSAVFPTALFFSAAYAEALFLLTTVASVFHARQGQWKLAGLWAFLAALTRLQGILLIIPLGYELWRQGSLRPGRASLRPVVVLMAPAGLLAFMAYLQWTVGDPLAFLLAQSAWLRGFALPPETLLRGVVMAVAGEADATRHAMGILNTVAGLFSTTLALAAFRRIRQGYALYALAAVTLALSAPVPDMPTVSVARFTVVIFPLFLVLARWGRSAILHTTVVAVSTAVFALLTALFVSWYWVV